MTNFLILAAVGLAVGLAAGYIYRSKKRGVTCIGCPNGGTCGGCSGCSSGF